MEARADRTRRVAVRISAILAATALATTVFVLRGGIARSVDLDAPYQTDPVFHQPLVESLPLQVPVYNSQGQISSYVDRSRIFYEPGTSGGLVIGTDTPTTGS